MKIFLLANNLIGLEIAKHLRKEHEDITGLAVHPPCMQKYTNEIISVSETDKTAISRSTKAAERTPSE